MPAGPPRAENPSVYEAEKPQVQKPKRLKDRLTDLYQKGLPFFAINLAWILLSLPVVTFFPALGGLYHAVLSYNRGETPGWASVWDGLKQHWWLSVKMGIVRPVGVCPFRRSLVVFQYHPTGLGHLCLCRSRGTHLPVDSHQPVQFPHAFGTART